MLYPRNTLTRRVMCLDGFWKFKFDPQGEGQKGGWTSGLSETVQMPVPASFNDFFTDKESREYTGDFWYETDFFVPGEWRDKCLDMRFDAAVHRAEVFINGEKAAEHEGGFLPFAVRLDSWVQWDAMNKVVVRLNNELDYTTLPAGKTITLKNGRKMVKPFFDFYNYSGLIRPVRITAIPAESILDYSVTHQLKGNDAVTTYEVTTTGDDDVRIALYDVDGNTAAECGGKSGELHVKNARLWSPEDPYLYTIKIEIYNKDGVIDEYCEEIGIRTVEIKGEEILLNGRPIYLKGFGKHEDADISGRGYNAPVIKRDMELMKWIGANSFRTSHYPYCEEMMQQADKEGFLVIDEVAAVGFFESIMNFLEASQDKAASFFSREEVKTETKMNHKAALASLIQRDKNHACVIAWSLLNEPETGDEAAEDYFTDIFALAKECDPQKRPCTFALIMNSTPDKCRCHKFADFISLNRYFGWYVKGGYEIEEAKELLIKEMEEWKKLNTNKPFVFTEFSADTIAGLHKLPSVMWSEEYQQEYLAMQFEVFDSYSFVKGEQVWNFADFQTTEGIMRADGNKKGIFTRSRQPKAAAYLLKKRWESLPADHKS